MQPLKIFIGFDHVESVAFYTLAHSIISRSSRPVSIIPVNLDNLRATYQRHRDPRQSNEFSFSRFMVPYLCNYEGFAVFMDCDQMVTTDITELFGYGYANPCKAVHVVKHDYTPSTTTKYLGNVQHAYPRKNWSSVVLWNCGHPSNRIVDLPAVNEWEPRTLHRFEWLDDAEIGELPLEWNWLVGEYPLGYKGVQERDVKNWHWTNYGPWLHDFEHVDGADLWFEERALMLNAVQNEDVGHKP